MNAPSRSLFAAALEAFVGILRFRKGPEDVPASTALLAAVVAGQVLLGMLLLSIPSPQPPENPLLLVGLELGVSMLGVLLILRMAGHPERFTQTMTAIFGSQLVIAPVLYAARWLLITYQQDAVLQAPSLFVSAVLAVWLLVISARILRSATDWPLFSCMFMVIGIQVVTVLVVLTLFPPAAPPAAPLGGTAAPA